MTDDIELEDYDELEYDDDSKVVDSEPSHGPIIKSSTDALSYRVNKLERKVNYVAIGAGLGIVATVGMLGRLLQQFAVVMQDLNGTNTEAKQLIEMAKRARAATMQTSQAQTPEEANGTVYDPGPQEVSPEERAEIKKIGKIDLHDEVGD